MWVVVIIMVPFWIPDIIRHLIFRVPQKRNIILTTIHVHRSEGLACGAEHILGRGGKLKHDKQNPVDAWFSCINVFHTSPVRTALYSLMVPVTSSFA